MSSSDIEISSQDEKAKLERMKKNVERSIRTWKDNAKRFHEFQRFAFKSNLTPSDKATNNQLQRPNIEFNVVNAPISRQCGEFSKQEPSINVMPRWGAPIDPSLIEFVEGHIRHIFDEAKNTNFQYLTYRNSLSGGYSNAKIWTEYEHEMSFEQVIRIGIPWNVTLCGYDPICKEQDKSDADFYWELFPFSKEQFKIEYPEINIDQLKFLKMDDFFNWSFKNNDADIIIVCDYYERKKEKRKIVKLANNQIMFRSDYNAAVKKWQEISRIEQPPIIIDSRDTIVSTIERSRIMETEILETEKTPFKYNSMIFFDGDSVVIQDEDNANIEQFTKPYIYHADGIQRLINFTGQVIANDFENMVQHKFMIAEEALPEQDTALEAWNNPQKAQLLVHKTFSDINPEHPLPVPREVSRVPLPPEVTTTFNNGMAMLQNILGSYDATLAQMDTQDISGKAIVEAATLSNGSTMPYIVNYMQGLTRLAMGIVDLIPKIFKTPRTIPVIKKDGTKGYVNINQEGGLKIDYDSNSLIVRVEAGVNFAIAKNRALQQLTLLMKISPEFSEFMSEVGLEVLLDNIEFRNADVLKSKVKEWQIKKEQQKKQQPNPEMIKAQAMQQQLQLQQQKLQLEGEELSSKATLETEKLILEKEKADNERLKIMMEAGESREKLEAAAVKAHAEETRAAADMHMKADHQSHTQFRELAETLIKHNQASNKHEKIQEKD